MDENEKPESCNAKIANPYFISNLQVLEPRLLQFLPARILRVLMLRNTVLPFTLNLCNTFQVKSQQSIDSKKVTWMAVELLSYMTQKMNENVCRQETNQQHIV